MGNSKQLTLWGVSLSRIALHVLFWIIAYLLFTSLYALQIKYSTSLRNNLFYVPLHIVYFYALAYWLVPKFVFTGKYVKFVFALLLLMFVITLVSRLVGIYIANPYILEVEKPDNWDFIYESKKPLIRQLLNPVPFANAWKATNMIVWAAIGIKMFKLFYERKQAALQAELNALKGQVHPHFLFNTLNNLYALTLNNSHKSSEVVMGLSEILRYMLYECNTDLVPLKQEVRVLEQYISLEKIRYEERLDVNFTIEGNLDDLLIAPLIMLPFVENAFKHGVSEQTGDAWININLAISGNVLKFKVSNSKPQQVRKDQEKHYGNIGLQNVKKRLELLYPSGYQLRIFDDNEDAYLVVLELTLVPGTVNLKQAQLIGYENTYVGS
ncbi:histidine kinase [Mucilaginibacter sp. RS28]|uniref:Histidine kinase n=1 Tax=Mucilaginibacter straminoryzae TaxID=2932774 RepID=A0A9X2BB36_9SPHI|nr:histidine kinase [Mucilaginibacter straminoryzae]MCJ8212026.1 histidine kinase [Mucilaginibacter straminoryzae]